MLSRVIQHRTYSQRQRDKEKTAIPAPLQVTKAGMYADHGKSVSAKQQRINRARDRELEQSCCIIL
jgi:hypothetical protein